MVDRPKVLSTTPLFVVADLQRAIDFYTQKLGFTDPSAWGEPPCFGMLNRDGFDLMFSVAEAPDHVRPNGPDGVWDAYIRVTDLAAETAALRMAGVAVAKGPTETFYGMTEIEVIDPDGYRICFCQKRR